MFDGAGPQIERSATAAFEDLHFSVAAERVFARTVVAHVRQGTVGSTRLDSTHPFSYGGWMFAHNGTVTGFERARPTLVEETLPRWRDTYRGTTDSEVLFYWLMSRMAEAGIDPEESCSDLARLVEVFAESVPYVDGLCAAAQAPKPARLNLILTDGNILVATRWRRTLHWLERPGVPTTARSAAFPTSTKPAAPITGR